MNINQEPKWRAAIDRDRCLPVDESPYDTIELVDIEDAPVVVAGRLQRQVAEFHRLMGAPVADRLQTLSVERAKLRLSLILEEVEELSDAIGSDGMVSSMIANARHLIQLDSFDRRKFDLVDVADALGDISYVVAGTAVEFGIPLEAVCDEIHRSNLTKAGGETRADGKILKPASYVPPRLDPILFGEGRPK